MTDDQDEGIHGVTGGDGENHVTNMIITKRGEC